MYDDRFKGTTRYDRQKTCPKVEMNPGVANNLAPCPFTIATSIGHVEHNTSYIWKPLQRSSRVKPGDPSVLLLLMYVMIDVTIKCYNIFVGRQTFCPLGFGLDNWTN